jgi:uncharacterized membrane protein YqaE (UPF0057 family)
VGKEPEIELALVQRVRALGLLTGLRANKEFLEAHSNQRRVHSYDRRDGLYCGHTELAKWTDALRGMKGGILSVDILRIVLAIILPPLGVFLQVGLTKHFWINILLTILGYVPGLVHAVWVIATFPRKEWSSS